MFLAGALVILGLLLDHINLDLDLLEGFLEVVVLVLSALELDLLYGDLVVELFDLILLDLSKRL